MSDALKLSRRTFVQGLGGAALATGLRVPLLGRLAALANSADTSLVVLLVRGGVDGLTLCAPYAEPEYYKLRPTLALPEPRKGGAGALIDLDGFFALDPAMS